MKRFFMLSLLLGSMCCFADAEYQFRLPIRSKASVRERGNTLFVECEFVPAKVLDKISNRKIDARHAKKIAFNAFRMYVAPKATSIAVHGLVSSQKASYDGNKNCKYYFSVPKQGVLVADQSRAASAKTAPQTAGLSTSSSSSQAASLPEPAGKNVVSHTFFPNGLIADGDLKSLELSGYSIRMKQDILSIMESFEDEFSCIKQEADIDALDKLQPLGNRASNRLNELKEVVSNDSHLLASEAADISGSIDRFSVSFQKSLCSFGSFLSEKLLREVHASLDDVKRNLQDASPDEKAEYEDMIKVLKSTVGRLQKTRRCFM